MIKLLTVKEHSELISLLEDTISEAGYPPEEAIPALVHVIGDLARTLPDPGVALDEASELLSEQEA